MGWIYLKPHHSCQLPLVKKLHVSSGDIWECDNERCHKLYIVKEQHQLDGLQLVEMTEEEVAGLPDENLPYGREKW